MNDLTLDNNELMKQQEEDTINKGAMVTEIGLRQMCVGCIRLKAMCEHGEFIKRINENTVISYDQAKMYLRIGKFLESEKGNNSLFENLGITALNQLALPSTPDEIVNETINAMENGDKVNAEWIKEKKQLLKDLEQKEKEKNEIDEASRKLQKDLEDMLSSNDDLEKVVDDQNEREHDLELQISILNQRIKDIEKDKDNNQPPTIPVETVEVESKESVELKQKLLEQVEELQASRLNQLDYHLNEIMGLLKTLPNEGSKDYCVGVKEIQSRIADTHDYALEKIGKLEEINITSDIISRIYNNIRSSIGNNTMSSILDRANTNINNNIMSEPILNQKKKPGKPKKTEEQREQERQSLLNRLDVKGITDMLINNMLTDKELSENRLPEEGSPAYFKWLNHVRLMIDEDGKDPERIMQVLTWLPSHKNPKSDGTVFKWKHQILSTAKLREQFGKLWGIMTGGTMPTKEDEIDRLLS